MLDATTATTVLLGLSVLLLVVIPALDASKYFNKYISLRYTLTAVFALLAVGCVIDFSHLGDATRNYVVIGGAVLIGLFVVARSLEKVKLGGKTIEIEAHKGDAGASAKIRNQQGGSNDQQSGHP